MALWSNVISPPPSSFAERKQLIQMVMLQTRAEEANEGEGKTDPLKDVLEKTEEKKKMNGKNIRQRKRQR